MHVDNSLQQVELPVQNAQDEAKNDMNTCLKMLFEASQDIQTDIQEVWLRNIET